MAIQDYKVSEAYSGRDIASLSDRPNQDGMTAAQLKPIVTGKQIGRAHV